MPDATRCQRCHRYLTADEPTGPNGGHAGWCPEGPSPDDGTRYKIVRMYARRGKRTIAQGLTLAEAQKHCSDPQTSWKTCTTSAGRARTRRMGPWFDGYDRQ